MKTNLIKTNYLIAILFILSLVQASCSKDPIDNPQAPKDEKVAEKVEMLKSGKWYQLKEKSEQIEEANMPYKLFLSGEYVQKKFEFFNEDKMYFDADAPMPVTNNDGTWTINKDNSIDIAIEIPIGNVKLNFVIVSATKDELVLDMKFIDGNGEIPLEKGGLYRTKFKKVDAFEEEDPNSKNIKILQSGKWYQLEEKAEQIEEASAPYFMFLSGEFVQKKFEFFEEGKMYFDADAPMPVTNNDGTWTMNEDNSIDINIQIPIGKVKLNFVIVSATKEELVLDMKFLEGIGGKPLEKAGLYRTKFKKVKSFEEEKEKKDHARNIRFLKSTKWSQLKEKPKQIEEASMPYSTFLSEEDVQKKFEFFNEGKMYFDADTTKPITNHDGTWTINKDNSFDISIELPIGKVKLNCVIVYAGQYKLVLDMKFIEGNGTIPLENGGLYRTTFKNVETFENK